MLKFRRLSKMAQPGPKADPAATTIPKPALTLVRILMEVVSAMYLRTMHFGPPSPVMNRPANAIGSDFSSYA